MAIFGLSDAVNGAADKICNMVLVRRVVRNPLFTALLITALIAVIAMAFYGSSIRNSGLKKAARVFIYSLLATTAVSYLSYHTMSRMFSETERKEEMRNVFNGIELSRANSVTAAVPRIGGAPVESPRADNLSQSSLIEDVFLPRYLSS